jgi:hypothetical protein
LRESHRHIPPNISNYDDRKLKGNAMECTIARTAESTRRKSKNGIKMPTWFIGFVTFLGLVIASSEASFAQVSGTFTSTEDCIVVFSPATFNSEFQATGAPVFHSIAKHLGVITFNTNGTGNAEILLGISNFMPIPPGNFAPRRASGRGGRPGQGL